MSVAKKSRAVVIGGLAASLLGRFRVAGKSFSTRQVETEFPAFNEGELEHALGELMEKQLITQDARSNYSLTEQGRTGRVSVA